MGLLVAVALGVALLAFCVRAPMPTPAGWSVVSVDANGSLWKLASSHPVTGLSTAETVELIQRENSLDSATIYAGQTLRVPNQTTAEGVALAQR